MHYAHFSVHIRHLPTIVHHVFQQVRYQAREQGGRLLVYTFLKSQAPMDVPVPVSVNPSSGCSLIENGILLVELFGDFEGLMAGLCLAQFRKK